MFNVAAIFLASFVNPKAYWKTEKRDYLFALIALVGFVLWRITDDPALAIGFSIVADALAAMPTFIKALKQPESENGKSFVIWTFSSIILVLIVEKWEFSHYAFPIYLVLFNASLAYFINVRPELHSK